jgi:hypothetical protein
MRGKLWLPLAGPQQGVARNGQPGYAAQDGEV